MNRIKIKDKYMGLLKRREERETEREAEAKYRKTKDSQDTKATSA